MAVEFWFSQKQVAVLLDKLTECEQKLLGEYQRRVAAAAQVLTMEGQISALQSENERLRAALKREMAKNERLQSNAFDHACSAIYSAIDRTRGTFK